MEHQKIRRYIEQLEEIAGYLHGILKYESDSKPLILSEEDSVREFTELRLLMKSDSWPLAVDDSMAKCESKQDRLKRASLILNSLIAADLENKSFLDYGCGDGCAASLVASVYGPKIAVGYALRTKNWLHLDPSSKLHLTTEWDDASSRGPFDVIMLNDVLDHDQTLEDSLKKIKSVMSDACRVYIKCHPWTSRHGAHAHESANKAFVHLVFSEEELAKMGIKTEATHKLLNPLESYRRLFKEQGFSVVREEVVSSDVERIFSIDERLRRRILTKWKQSNQPEYASGEQFPHEHMSVEFVLFTLL